MASRFGSQCSGGGGSSVEFQSLDSQLSAVFVSGGGGCEAPGHQLGHGRPAPRAPLAHLTLPLCRADGAAAAAAAAEDEDEEALPEEEENRPILPYSSFFILSSTNP